MTVGPVPTGHCPAPANILMAGGNRPYTELSVQLLRIVTQRVLRLQAKVVITLRVMQHRLAGETATVSAKLTHSRCVLVICMLAIM